MQKKTAPKTLTELRGAFTKACDAVRAADHDPRVTVDVYTTLVAAREQAFAEYSAAVVKNVRWVPAGN